MRYRSTQRQIDSLEIQLQQIKCNRLCNIEHEGLRHIQLEIEYQLFKIQQHSSAIKMEFPLKFKEVIENEKMSLKQESIDYQESVKQWETKMSDFKKWAKEYDKCMKARYTGIFKIFNGKPPKRLYPPERPRPSQRLIESVES